MYKNIISMYIYNLICWIFFSVVMKAHQSHDVLLLCPSCHEISNNHDLQLRRKLADMCDAPLIGPMTHVRDNYLHNRRKLHSAVKALREKFTLPQRQREEYESYILEHTGQQKITPDLLNVLNEQLKNALIQKPIPTKYQPHGLKVLVLKWILKWSVKSLYYSFDFYSTGGATFSKARKWTYRVGTYVERTFSFHDETEVPAKFMVCTPQSRAVDHTSITK